MKKKNKVSEQDKRLCRNVHIPQYQALKYPLVSVQKIHDTTVSFSNGTKDLKQCQALVGILQVCNDAVS